MSKLHKFEIKNRDAAGRMGVFHTAHGDVETPVLLPVVNPNLEDAIKPKELKETFGAQILITNSYIIYKNEHLKTHALEKGLHDLLDFDGAVWTDSGTFQLYMYGDIDVQPDDIVKFQAEMGSDVATMLDLFTKPDEDREKAQADMKENLIRVERAAKLKGDSALAGTIQGGVFPDLREQCAKDMSKTDCDIHPIGGVVPIMENYWYKHLAQVIIGAKKGLDPSRPVHLFGAGHPMIFPLATALGCDMFDSASYAKYATQGRMMFDSGTKHLKDLDYLPCHCPICASTTAKELKALPEKEKVRQLSLHNLHICFGMIKQIKQAISEGTLWDLVERTCTCHPKLFEALKVVGDNADFLEQFEPTSKKRFFYTGPHSLHRPEIHRFRTRIKKRYSQPDVPFIVTFDGDHESRKPYTKSLWDNVKKVTEVANCQFMVRSPLGPVPLELEGMYPVGQSVLPEVIELPEEERKKVARLFEEYSHGVRHIMGIMWDGEQTLETIKTLHTGPVKPYQFDILKVMAICDYQFGKGAAEALLGSTDLEELPDRVRFNRSKNTDMIRNVFVDDEHILSMRASDGLFTLKKAGALKMLEVLPSPQMRVIVDDDSFEFNKEGKNVFAGFVLDCDPEIRPGDDILIVNQKDEFANVGRAVMNRMEMMAFDTGIAVRTR